MSRAFAAIGTVLAAIGVLGFFANPLLGVFSAGLVHNLVHLTTGALALAASRHDIGAMRTWGKALGLAYLALALLGLAWPGDDLPGRLHLARPDNLLHLGAAAFFLYYALLAPPRR